jgi:superfamily II DNA or RNA helicase
MAKNIFINNSSEKLDYNLAELFKKSDEIDILVSFVKVSGVEALRILLNEVPEIKNKKIRVITSTYMCITQPHAIELLQKLIGEKNEIKIEYNLANYSSTLHAKAWLFGSRVTDVYTFIIGSSNISALAIASGKEWNLRADNDKENYSLAKQEFNKMWESNSFLKYDKQQLQRYYSENKEKIQEAVNDASNQVGLYGYQEKIVSKAIGMYKKGVTKMVILAATGTGKTIMAAEIAKRLLETEKYKKVIYIAEKDEILVASLNQFRKIMENDKFGKFKSSNKRLNEKYNSTDSNLFINKNTLINSMQEYIKSLEGTIIIIDECHHSKANTYKKMLEAFGDKPFLMGLTATPDRMDGKDILEYYGGQDGIVEDLRLSKALSMGILSPFVYYAISENELMLNGLDESNLNITHKRFKEYVYRKINYICDEIYNKIDPEHSKILLFCQDHEVAKFLKSEMNSYFQKTNERFTAETILSSTDQESRSKKFENFRNGNINMIIAVDVLNEGIDVPDIDVVIFLRPTKSPIVFLQQLGRGLRKSINKSEVTVLDFVQNYNHKYDILRHYQNINPELPREIIKAASSSTTTQVLVNDCVFVLTKISKELILENIKNMSKIRKSIHGTIAQYGIDYKAIFNYDYESVDLTEVLNYFNLKIEDIYRDKGSLFKFINGVGQKSDEVLWALSNAYNFSTVNDQKRFEEYLKLCNDISAFDENKPLHRMFLTLLFRRNLKGNTKLISKRGKETTGKYINVNVVRVEDIISYLEREKEILTEVKKVLIYAKKRNLFVPSIYRDCLAENAIYTDDELCGFIQRKNRFTPGKQYPFQEEGIDFSDLKDKHYLRANHGNKVYGELMKRFQNNGILFRFTLPKEWKCNGLDYSGKYSERFYINSKANDVYLFIEKSENTRTRINGMKKYFFANNKKVNILEGSLDIFIELPNDHIYKTLKQE